MPFLSKSDLADPAVKVFLGAISVAVVVTGVLLLLLFTDVGWVACWKVWGRFPSERTVLKRIYADYPSVEFIERGVRHTNRAGERSQLYDLLAQDAEVRYLLIVVQRDVPCSGCDDLLFMVMYDLTARKIERVWTLVGLDFYEEPMHITGFLDQFVGKGIEDSLSFGKDIDGITGATESSEKMVEGINEANVSVQFYFQFYSKGTRAKSVKGVQD